MTLTRIPFHAVEDSVRKVTTGEHTITVLMVDDQALFGQAVRNMLSDQPDIKFHFCDKPTEALKVAEEIRPTVILQDLLMPDIDGLTMVKFFRANPVTKEVPMIVLSSREEADVKSEAFALGANDYMVKLPDKLEVLARIRYHSRAYINLLQRNEAYSALVASQEALKSELAEAERYIKSLLPAKIDSEHLKTDWVYTPSTDLGGDAFGYHWLDDEHFAIYLLDVCGHGVGASLLSVSAMNVLRSESLRGVDFLKPASVLSGLNEAFDMDKQNQMYFTLWYGIYNRTTRILEYASGGHPPSILVRAKGTEIKHLMTHGIVIGGMPGAPFPQASIEIEPNDKLYVFSDGVYEVTPPGQKETITVDDYAAALVEPPIKGLSKVKSMVKFSQDAQQKEPFEDDYSLVEICFL